jgi:WD40 repeat protein
LLTGGEDRTARLWDTATGEPSGKPLAHPDAVWSVAFSPDGKTFLTGTGGDDCKARLWKTATGRPVGAPLASDAPIRLVAFSPDGRTVLAASPTSGCCWRTRDGRPVRALWFKPNGVFSPAAFSPDGRVLVGDDRGTLRVWDAASARVLREWPSPEGLKRIQFSPDGTGVLLRFANHSAQLWDVGLGRPRTPPLFHREAEIWAAAFSPDGRTVLTGSADGAACLWDAATGKQLGPPVLHPGIVTGVAFGGDGRTFVAACEDGTVLLWPAPGEETGNPDAVRRRLEALTGLRLDDRGIVRRPGVASRP